jgi:hypothetical protein
MELNTELSMIGEEGPSRSQYLAYLERMAGTLQEEALATEVVARSGSEKGCG